MRIRLKYITGLITAFLFISIQPVWAAGPPGPTIFDSPLAITLFVFMLILLIIIGTLAYVLIGAANIAVKKRTEEKKTSSTTTAKTTLLLLFLTMASSLFAQNNTATTVGANTGLVGGMTASAFYVMVSVIFLELTVILVLLFNMRVLLKKENEKAIEKELSPEAAKEIKRTKLSWWDKFNKLRPVSQEAELDLGHEYDGIRELNNRLPPWWLYGFYATIVFAFIYLWRFHISHTAPSSKQEYEYAVVNAEQEIKEYLKAKGEAVDENTVTLLTSADDLAAGKTLFVNSCAACHKETGAGDVGPNLTDDYWLHGNDPKSIFKTIRYGVNAMPQWQNAYSNKQIALLMSYVKSLHGTNPANPKAPQGVEMKEEINPGKPSADSLKVLSDKKIVSN